MQNPNDHTAPRVLCTLNTQFRTLITIKLFIGKHKISVKLWNSDKCSTSIAAILQAQIFDDLFNPDLTEDNFLDFNIIVDLPAEYGGDPQTIPENILNHETLNDLELREKLLEGKVPTVDTIYRYCVDEISSS